MAFQTVLDELPRLAGIHRTAFRSVPPTVQSLTLRLIGTWTTAADIALFGIEATNNGGITTRHIVSAAVYGGSRTRDGSNPTISFTPNPALEYRVFLLLGVPTDVGLEIEVL